jgi:RNA polymerase sigma-70 factor (ECF subfamily)
MELIEPSELKYQGGGGRAASELRAYLRRGLQRAFAGQPLLENDLDDFTHDAIIRILEKLHTFRGDSRFTTWAMAIAIRVAFGTLRRRRYRERLRAEDLESADVDSRVSTHWEDPARAPQRRALLDALYRAVHEKLTERQRAAVLGELEGVPSEQLADRLGITRNTLYKLHHDARRKLRRTLLEAGFTEEHVREELQAASEES